VVLVVHQQQRLADIGIAQTDPTRKTGCAVGNAANDAVLCQRFPRKSEQRRK
jgi:hypothetical protein